MNDERQMAKVDDERRDLAGVRNIDPH